MELGVIFIVRACGGNVCVLGQVVFKSYPCVGCVGHVEILIIGRVVFQKLFDHE